MSNDNGHDDDTPTAEADPAAELEDCALAARQAADAMSHAVMVWHDIARRMECKAQQIRTRREHDAGR